MWSRYKAEQKSNVEHMKGLKIKEKINSLHMGETVILVTPTIIWCISLADLKTP